jgi:hypothetical protein
MLRNKIDFTCPQCGRTHSVTYNIAIPRERMVYLYYASRQDRSRYCPACIQRGYKAEQRKDAQRIERR